MRPVSHLVAAFALGALSALVLVTFQNGVIEYKFGIFDLINGLLTLCLAIYISHVIENRNELSRSERELLISHVKEVATTVEDIRALCVKSLFAEKKLTPEDYGAVLDKFRESNNFLYLLKQVADRSGRRPAVSAIADSITKMQNYKSAVTGGLGSSPERQARTYRELVDSLHAAIYEINRSHRARNL